MSERERPTVVIGMYGSQRDAGRGDERWERWRPTVDLCRQEDLLVSRLELLLDPRHERAAEALTDDLRAVSPETEVRLHALPFPDAWDFARVYGTLFEFARGYPFEPDHECYLVHATTGGRSPQPPRKRSLPDDASGSAKDREHQECLGHDRVGEVVVPRHRLE